MKILCLPRGHCGPSILRVISGESDRAEQTGAPRERAASVEKDVTSGGPAGINVVCERGVIVAVDTRLRSRMSGELQSNISVIEDEAEKAFERGEMDGAWICHELCPASLDTA